MQNINLKKFNPKMMEERRIHPNQGPPTILIIGARNTGKTYLLSDLLYHFRKIPVGLFFTGSEASAENFAKFFPKSFIYDEVDISKIENIVKKQRELRKKNTEGDYSSLLLFDDCGYDKKTINNKIIKGVFCNGRNWKILLVMTIQYCKDIPPDFRSNVDYVFLLREPIYEVRKKLWKEYAGIIPKFEIFNEIMNACTEDRGALVIDKTTTSNNLEDNIFWYRARSPLKNFKIGSKELWEFHKQNYNSDEDTNTLDQQLKNKAIVVKKTTLPSKKKKESTSKVSLADAPVSKS